MAKNKKEQEPSVINNRESFFWVWLVALCAFILLSAFNLALCHGISLFLNSVALVLLVALSWTFVFICLLDYGGFLKKDNEDE